MCRWEFSPNINKRVGSNKACKYVGKISQKRIRFAACLLESSEYARQVKKPRFTSTFKCLEERPIFKGQIVYCALVLSPQPRLASSRLQLAVAVEAAAHSGGGLRTVC